MREIKFRTWDGVLDVMVQWDALANSFASCLYDKNYKIMQFTGLKDKNGKEIYEGDILRGEDHSTVKIIWDGASFCMEDRLLDSWIAKDHERYWEVIGNIYENPELIADRE